MNRQNSVQSIRAEIKRKGSKKDKDVISVELKQRDSKDVVTLLLKDGKQLKASRNMLSAASPFFSALLGSDMRENREGLIRLEYISEPVMRGVLKFVACGSTDVTATNVQDLIETADYLLLPNLKIYAGRFLIANLTISNCISIYYFAEKYHCDESWDKFVVRSVREFILSNFITVAQSRDFLNLESKQVERWISCDKMVVSTEDDVFKIILKWIGESNNERREKFEELFRHVRLAFVSRDLRRDLLANNLVIENPRCLKFVRDAFKLVYHSSNGASPLLSRNWKHTHLFVLFGRQTLCYDPDQKKWYKLQGPRPVNSGDKLTSFQGKLYLSSFCNARDAEHYDPFIDFSFSLHWKLSGFLTQLTVVDGEMYAVVERNIMGPKVGEESKVIKYEMESNSWKLVSSFVFEGCSGTLGACAVAMDNYLYIIGGKQNDSAHTVRVRPTAGRFNITEMKWEKIASLQQARYLACGVAARGKIFVAGGRTSCQTPNQWNITDTCEVYNPVTDEWHFVASLNRPRSGGSMLCLEGKLYVVGGVHYDESHKSLYALAVESYSFKTDTWTVNTTIPISFNNSTINGENWAKACTQGVRKELLKKTITKPLKVTW